MIIIDMQRDFIEGSLANKMAEKILPRISELIKNFDGRIIFTRDTHDKNYLNTNEGKHLPVEHCIKGTYGHQIHRDLLGWKDADFFDKKYFGSTDFANVIQDYIWHERREELGIKEFDENYDEEYDNNLEFHFCGTCTDICVVSNVLLFKAAFPEAKIIVHKNHCAGLDKKGHDAALLIMERCQCEIVD